MTALPTAASLAPDIARIAAALDLGTASARKTGRDPRWPYVPVVAHTDSPRGYVKQVMGLAYATRPEAIARAQAHIDALRRRLAGDLATPRMRALREQHGLPREIAGEAQEQSERLWAMSPTALAWHLRTELLDVEADPCWAPISAD